MEPSGRKHNTLAVARRAVGGPCQYPTSHPSMPNPSYAACPWQARGKGLPPRKRGSACTGMRPAWWLRPTRSALAWDGYCSRDERNRCAWWDWGACSPPSASQAAFGGELNAPRYRAPLGLIAQRHMPRGKSPSMSGGAVLLGAYSMPLAWRPAQARPAALRPGGTFAGR